MRVTPLAPDDVRAPDLRLTVDTPDDLAYVRRLATALERRWPSTRASRRLPT